MILIFLIIANTMIEQYLHLHHIGKRGLTPTISESKVVEPDDHNDNGDNDESVDDDNDNDEMLLSL